MVKKVQDCFGNHKFDSIATVMPKLVAMGVTRLVYWMV